jgi:hypothetical protein
MKNKTWLIGFLLFIHAGALAQVIDTTYVLPEAEYEDYETDEAVDTSALYTIEDPALLPVTQSNNQIPQAKQDFNKARWKEIVGETNYAEKEPPQKDQSAVKSSSPVWNPAFLKILGFALLFAIAIVILYFLVKNTFANENLGKIAGDSDSLLFDNQHIDDVTEQDLEVLLKRALTNKDFRGAIRLYYIRLLKHLHNTNHIAWKKDKTNRDYATELAPETWALDFRRITLAYEIVWYGERTPSSLEFEALQKNFNELHDKTSAIPA